MKREFYFAFLKNFIALMILTGVASAQEQPSYRQIREAQSLLHQADFNPGPIDGVWGSRTEAALISFLEDIGLSYDGILSENELELLRVSRAGLNYRIRTLHFNEWLRSSRLNFSENCESSTNSNCTNSAEDTSEQGNFETPYVTIYSNSWGLPYRESPDRDTLLYYIYRNQFSHFSGDPDTLQWHRYEIDPAITPFSLQENRSERSQNFISMSSLSEDMNERGVLSYLIYDQGQVVVDELSSQERFGAYINNETRLRSNSMGRSMVSYVLGHAICAGYIESEEALLADWPLLSDTLYEDQRIIDLLNMRAGDQEYVSGGDLIGIARERASSSYFEIDTASVARLMDVMRDLPRGEPIYNYSNISTAIVFNYIAYRTGDQFQSLLDSVFRDGAGISNSVYFFRLPGAPVERGNANNMFFASRYDYLRIAIAIMRDLQNDTCVGQYLNRIFQNRLPKGSEANEPAFNSTMSYGGQFHFDYPGLEGRYIFGMGGYGGQAILIDPETSRIVTLHSAHFNNTQYRYNVENLLIRPFIR